MNHLLLQIQGFLSITFMCVGCVKLISSKEKMSKAPNSLYDFTWVNDFSLRTVRIIGLSEFIGGIALFAPLLFHIHTILSPIVAVGICLIMILAITTVHLKKKQYKFIAINIVWFLMAAFVAYGRFRQVITKT
jgi:hypothetical protein